MAVWRSAPAPATAVCRSVVNVAIPQRRGNELPMKATRRKALTVALADGGLMRSATARDFSKSVRPES